MLLRSLSVWLFFGLAACTASAAHRPSEDRPLHRIAFGSCFGTDGPPGIWTTVREVEPDTLVLLGDNVYADTRDMDVMRARYAELDAIEDFAHLRGRANLLATWDDHDYGVNDGGAEYPMRAEAQQVFLDFLREAEDSPRRRREGVYDARIFGPPGRRVQVLLLDTRYHRSPLESGPPGLPDLGRYVSSDDPGATFLGEAQWAWLEEELRKPADMRLLASSIQVVAEDHRFERWMNFPHERRRLFELLQRTGASGVIAISGDRHMAEISVLDPDRAAPMSALDLGYPFIDVTASSLNRPGTPRNEPNRHRKGEPYFHANFGTIDVDWVSRELVICIRGENGEVTLRHEVALEDLRRPGQR